MPRFRNYGLEAGAPEWFGAMALRNGIAKYEKSAAEEKKQIDGLCKAAKEGDLLAAINLKKNYACKVYTKTEITGYQEATA